MKFCRVSTATPDPSQWQWQSKTEAPPHACRSQTSADPAQPVFRLLNEQRPELARETFISHAEFYVSVTVDPSQTAVAVCLCGGRCCPTYHLPSYLSGRRLPTMAAVQSRAAPSLAAAGRRRHEAWHRDPGVRISATVAGAHAVPVTRHCDCLCWQRYPGQRGWQACGRRSRPRRRPAASGACVSALRHREHMTPARSLRVHPSKPAPCEREPHCQVPRAHS